MVPGGQWDAGLQLPLHQLHGAHCRVVLLEETSSSSPPGKISRGNFNKTESKCFFCILNSRILHLKLLSLAAIIVCVGCQHIQVPAIIQIINVSHVDLFMICIKMLFQIMFRPEVFRAE